MKKLKFITLIDKIYSIIYVLYLKSKGATIEKNVIICRGSKIKVHKKLYIGERTIISQGVKIYSPEVYIGKNSAIFPRTFIYTKKKFELGERSKIGRDCVFKGNSIKIENELWCNEFVDIGGGGWENPTANLRIGPKQLICAKVQINLSEEVVIEGFGGLGVESMIYTHGAGHGQPFTEGFYATQAPVNIKSNVSILTRAMVLPGVNIERFSTIGAYCVVTKSVNEYDIIAGVPGKKIGSNNKTLSFKEREQSIIKVFNEIFDVRNPTEHNSLNLYKFNETSIIYTYSIQDKDLYLNNEKGILIFYEGCIEKLHLDLNKWTLINLKESTISGCTNNASEFVRDKLRRKGVLLEWEDYFPNNINYHSLVNRGIELT